MAFGRCPNPQSDGGAKGCVWWLEARRKAQESGVRCFRSSPHPEGPPKQGVRSQFSANVVMTRYLIICGYYFVRCDMASGFIINLSLF